MKYCLIRLSGDQIIGWVIGDLATIKSRAVALDPKKLDALGPHPSGKNDLGDGFFLLQDI